LALETSFILEAEY